MPSSYFAFLAASILVAFVSWAWAGRETAMAPFWYIDTAAAKLSRCAIKILGVACDVPSRLAAAGGNRNSCEPIHYEKHALPDISHAPLFLIGITLSVEFIGPEANLQAIMSYVLATFASHRRFSLIGAQIARKERAMEHHLLNAYEAAEVLKMDSRTLIRWARLGHVPAHPMGEGRRKLWRFLEDELLEWVEARKVEKKGPLASRIELAISAHARRSA